jgi:hypothetical protein
LQPAAPPSSANLAAAGTQSSAGIQIPVTSPETIANAPLANYPTIDASAGAKTITPGSVLAASGATASSPLATNPTTTLPSASMPGQLATATIPASPTSAPYDPNGYRPPAAMSPLPASVAEASPPSVDRYQIASADRYGTSPATSAAVAAEPTRSIENTTTTAPTTPSQATGDRYGLGLGASTANPPVNSPASQPSTEPYAPAAMATTAAPPPVSAAPAAPNSAASVQLATPPGQYRPGGTSSYVGSAPKQTIEVATRPAAPAANASPAQTTTPVDSSVPWTPPATQAPSQGTRTY